jgi:hypothetical protein
MVSEDRKSGTVLDGANMHEILESYQRDLHRVMSTPPEMRVHTERMVSLIDDGCDSFRYSIYERTRGQSLRRMRNAFIGVDYSAQQERRIIAELNAAYHGASMVQSGALIDAPSREILARLPITSEPDATPRAALATESELLLGYKPLREAVKSQSALHAVLAKLEIDVLDEVTVNAYKAQMVQHYATHKKMIEPTWRLAKLSEYNQPVPEFVLRKACDIKRELPQAMFYIDQLAVDPFLIVSLKPITDYLINRERGLDAETQAYIEVWDEPKFESENL